VFAFRERVKKVLGKFASFRPRAGRRPHRRLRIDSSKGNSYPLTGRNSLRGEILEPCTYSARAVDFQDARHRDVASRSRPPTRIPKLMPVPRSNLSAYAIYYGTLSPSADEWPSVEPKKICATSLRAYSSSQNLTNETSKDCNEHFSHKLLA